MRYDLGDQYAFNNFSLFYYTIVRIPISKICSIIVNITFYIAISYLEMFYLKKKKKT